MKIVFSPELMNMKNDNLKELANIIEFVDDCVINPQIDRLAYYIDTSKIPLYQNNMILNNMIKSVFLTKYRKLLMKNINTKTKDSNKIFDEYINNLDDNVLIVFVTKSQVDIDQCDILKNNKKNCIVLCNPYTCEYSIIKDIVKDQVKNTDLFSEYLCKHVQEYFKIHSIKKDSERNQFDFEFGKIVAERNQFIYNTSLSKINSKKSKRKRNVYSKPTIKNPKYHISIDTEHGGLEVFLHKKISPEHLGEYNYSCKKVKEADPQKHILYLKQ